MIRSAIAALLLVTGVGLLVASCTAATDKSAGEPAMQPAEIRVYSAEKGVHHD